MWHLQWPWRRVLSICCWTSPPFISIYTTSTLSLSFFRPYVRCVTWASWPSCMTLTLAALHFDTIVVMDAGSIQAQGAPEDILHDPDAMSVFRAPLDVVSHPQTGTPQVLLQRGPSQR